VHTFRLHNEASWVQFRQYGAVPPACNRGRHLPALSMCGPRMGKEDQMRTQEMRTQEMRTQEMRIQGMRTQGVLASRKKPPIMPCGPRRSRSSEPKDEAPFPLRVTRVVTATLPSSLVARRVAVEDPPPEFSPPLPEQLPDPPMMTSSCRQTQGPPSRPLNPGAPPHDLGLTPEQREAKLRRVQRIRERVVHQRVPLLTDDRKLAVQMPGVCYHSDAPVEEEQPSRGRGGPAKHHSSVTRYQREDGRPVSPDRRHGDRSRSSRAQWFLSTNQWQGFIPLHSQGAEPLCDQEVADIICRPDQTELASGAADASSSSSSSPSSTSSSSHVSHLSLEKMKENHALFYQIACDVSISDTDAPPGDHNGNHGNEDAERLGRPREGGPVSGRRVGEPLGLLAPSDGFTGPPAPSKPGGEPEETPPLSPQVLPDTTSSSSSSSSSSPQQDLLHHHIPGEKRRFRGKQEEEEEDASHLWDLPGVTKTSEELEILEEVKRDQEAEHRDQQEVKMKRDQEEVKMERHQEEVKMERHQEEVKMKRHQEEMKMERHQEEVNRDQQEVKMERHQEEVNRDQQEVQRRQEQTRMFRKSSSLSDSRETLPGDITVLRGAGLGSTRVTVLRTSL
ncbi:hypothetical protein NHX12_024601, partial [Muraenolepis orangiensis]